MACIPAEISLFGSCAVETRGVRFAVVGYDSVGVELPAISRNAKSGGKVGPRANLGQMHNNQREEGDTYLCVGLIHFRRQYANWTVIH